MQARFVVATLLSFVSLWLAPRAQAASEPAPLRATAAFKPSFVEAGGTVDLAVDMDLAEHYHAYLERFKLVIESPDDLKLGELKIDPITKFVDVVTKKEKEGVSGHATLRTLIEVPPGFKAGTQNIALKLTYQACSEDHCLFPKSVEIKAPLSIRGTNQPSGVTPPTPVVAAATNDFERAMAHGTFWAFIVVFGFGFLTALTPCIYPMIPITLAVLGARAKGQSHAKNVSIAIVYVLGIALTYSALGVLAATTGTLFGSTLSNFWVVTAIAIVFIAMGLGMFGLFEIQAPAFVRNRLGGARTTSGYSGAFVTGLLAGVVASPCIGPVLVSVLTYIAQTKSPVFGFFLLFTFAFGMGLPFIALGFSSSMLTRLPKAGAWMESVKFFFGSLMIAMAFYYVYPLYAPWLFRLLVGIALVLLAGYFGAFLPSPLAPLQRLRKAALILVLTLGCVEFATGVLEKQGFVSTDGANIEDDQGPIGASALPWLPFSESSLQEAAKGGHPVLVDFSAEWCGACKEMDRSTFMDPRILDATKPYVLLRVDGTESSEALDALIAKYKVQGFPTYLFYDAHGKLRDDQNLFGYEEADKFLKRLQAVTGS